MLQSDILLQDDKLLQSLQELFPSSSVDGKKDEMLLLTDTYHSYKSKYVRQLSFNPEEDYFSKVISI